MKTVIVLWVATDGLARFHQAVPLDFIGQRNRRLGYSNDIDLVFLEGFELLDEGCRRRWCDLGFTLRDATALFQPHARRFAPLNRYGGFLRNCFLRWLVLAELYGDEPVLHVDGDVVFNESPGTLQQLMAGRTLVVQGCPALTVISDREWFRHYEAGLAALAADPAGYSTQAWRQRVGWETSFHTKWAGEWTGPVLGSDQDLISHLIHTDQLPQDDPLAFLTVTPEHVFFENPLIVGALVPARPLTYARREGVDHVAGRRVAFWHMQTDWCRYLAKYLLRERLHLLGVTGRIGFGRRDGEDWVGGALRKISGGHWLSRPALYEEFFARRDFSDVLTDRRWWQPGVWA